MRTKLVIMDSDGVIINPIPSSRIQDSIIENWLRYSLTRGIAISYMNEAKNRALKNPFENCWIYDREIAAFTEDAYLLRRAVLEQLWQHIEPALNVKRIEDPSFKASDLNSAYDYLFKKSTEGEDVKLMRGAKPLVDELVRREIDCVIITNSATERAEKAKTKLGADIYAHGYARKFIVERREPSIEIDGRRVYVYRPDYIAAVQDVMGHYDVNTDEVVSVGDSLLLDSLPLSAVLGIRGVLKINRFSNDFQTPRQLISLAKQYDMEVVGPSIGDYTVPLITRH